MLSLKSEPYNLAVYTIGTNYDGIVNNIHIYDNDLFVTESYRGKNTSGTKVRTTLAYRNHPKYNTPTTQATAIKYPEKTMVDYTNTKPVPYPTTPPKYITSTAPILNTYLPYKTYNVVATQAPSTISPSAYEAATLPGNGI